MIRQHQWSAALYSALLLLLSSPHVLASPIFTTTWTETKTYTSTISGKGGGGGGGAMPTDKSTPCVPQEDGWTACGWVCCDYYQECVEDGQCRVKPGFEEPPGEPIVITTDGHLTTLYSAPFRVTGSDGAESTGGAGGGGDSEGEDDGGGAQLSGGAIAGIVVGTLAGVGILGMICFCCIARGIFGAIFGGKKKKKDRERTREEIYEDRYTRRSSRPSSYYTKRGTHSSWYGSSLSGRGGGEKKKKSGGAKWLGLAGLAATLLALLNIRRDKKPERRTPTMYSDSYMYSDSTPSTPSPPFSPSVELKRTLTRCSKQPAQAQEADRSITAGTRGARIRDRNPTARTTPSARGRQRPGAAGEARLTSTASSRACFSRTCCPRCV